MHYAKTTLFLLVLLPILSFFQLSKSAEILSSISDEINRLEKIKQLIHETISDNDHNPHASILEQIFPEAANVIEENADRVEKCYNATLNGKEMNIFNQSIGEVIHEYLHKDFLKDPKATPESIPDKVTNLLHSIRSLARHVLDCVDGSGTDGVIGEDGKKVPTIYGLTKFAEMSGEDIRATYQQPLVEEDLDYIVEDNNVGGVLGRSIGEKLKPSDVVSKNSHFYVDSFKKYPSTFDYRDLGAVGPIKDQGYCGLCFLFGIMSAIESSYMLNKGIKNASLSEADIVNCMVAHKLYTGTAKKVVAGKEVFDPETGKVVLVPSCRPGGSQKNVLKEAITSGLTLHSQGAQYVRDLKDGYNYPFKPETCGTDPIVAKVTGWASEQDIKGNDDYLKAVLTKYGPVSTVFRTDLIKDRPHKNDPKYSGAFFNIKSRMHDACDPKTRPSHVMTIIGWEEDYWIIKNSYGNHKPGEGEGINAPWGENGWLYLEKSLARDCGLFGPGSQWIFPQVK